MRMTLPVSLCVQAADMDSVNLQALVYDTLPSTIAVFSYAIRVHKTVS